MENNGFKLNKYHQDRLVRRKGMILVIPKVASDEENLWLHTFAQARAGEFYHPRDHYGRSATEATILKVGGRSEPEYLEAEKRLFGVFNRAITRYSAEIEPRVISVSQDEGYHFLQYIEGRTLGLHIDDAHDKFRRIGAVYYPNDDYIGGELSFPDQDFEHKPRAGDVIIFPASYAYPHESKRVTQGTKFAATTWFK